MIIHMRHYHKLKGCDSNFEVTFLNVATNETVCTRTALENYNNDDPQLNRLVSTRLDRLTLHKISCFLIRVCSKDTMCWCSSLLKHLCNMIYLHFSVKR